MTQAQELLDLALQLGAIKYGDFTLSSGGKSTYYFDGRVLTLHSMGARLVGELLVPIVRRSGAQAIGGLTLGADPIVTSVALTSALDGGMPISAFIVRKEEKGHGMQQLVEGPLRVGNVAIVDDVCTTGGSLFHAIAAAEAYGCKVVLVMAILDRRQGGSDEIRRRGYNFTTLLETTPEEKIAVA